MIRCRTFRGNKIRHIVTFIPLPVISLRGNGLLLLRVSHRQFNWPRQPHFPCIFQEIKIPGLMHGMIISDCCPRWNGRHQKIAGGIFIGLPKLGVQVFRQQSKKATSVGRGRMMVIE
jgi:hypothetical protein